MTRFSNKEVETQLKHCKEEVEHLEKCILNLEKIRRSLESRGYNVNKRIYSLRIDIENEESLIHNMKIYKCINESTTCEYVKEYKILESLRSTLYRGDQEYDIRDHQAYLRNMIEENNDL